MYSLLLGLAWKGQLVQVILLSVGLFPLSSLRVALPVECQRCCYVHIAWGYLGCTVFTTLENKSIRFYNIPITKFYFNHTNLIHKLFPYSIFRSNKQVVGLIYLLIFMLMLLFPFQGHSASIEVLMCSKRSCLVRHMPREDGLLAPQISLHFFLFSCRS